MNTQAPRLYYSSSGGYYYVVADWGWVSNSWKDDASRWDYKNVGGLDVHAVRFSRLIKNFSSPAMTLCNKKVNITSGSNSCYTVSSYADNNSYGTAIQFQDKAFWGLVPSRGFTNADRGSLVMPFKRDEPGCLTMWARYGHSFSSTQLTGVDIGRDSFGFSWSTSSDTWGETSATTLLGC